MEKVSLLKISLMLSARAVLSEALRVLRPGGALIVCSSFSLDKTAMEEHFLHLLSERGLPFSRREEGPFRVLEIFR